jgi:hypothetical protein
MDRGGEILQARDCAGHPARICKQGFRPIWSPVWSVAVPSGAFAKVGSTADVCLSLRTLFVRSTLIGRGCLRHPEGPGGV